MTRVSRNMNGNKPAAGNVRGVLSFLLLALGQLPACDPARAAEPPRRASLSSSATTQIVIDLEVEAKIRRALRSDAQLRPLNLGVHMAGGTVKLSGPVPSAELKRRAMTIVEKVEGVLRVIAKDVYLSSSAQNHQRMIVLIMDDPPTQTRAASPNVPSGDLTPPARAHEPGQRVTLLAPETAPLPTRASDPTCLTANPRPTPPAVIIAGSVERLRRHDVRYQSIRTRVQDRTVSIFPGDAPSEDAMTFAQAVRRLPGVQHVIIASSSR